MNRLLMALAACLLVRALAWLVAPFVPLLVLAVAVVGVLAITVGGSRRL